MSIIIPIYNVEPHIPRCLRSLISQTDQDFELILVDDGCTDSSIRIAEELLQEAGRSYKLVSAKAADGAVKNQGAAAARNLGIREAQGVWVQMLDSDDYIEPKTVELAKNVIGEYPDAEFIFSDFVFEKNTKNEKGREVLRTKGVHQTKQFEGRTLLKAFYLREEPIAAPACAFRKDFVEKNKIWFPEGCYFSEDMYFVYQMLFKVHSAVKIEAKLYHYVERENSTMTSSGVERILSGYEWFKTLSDEVFRNQALREESREDFGFDLTNILPRWVLAASHTATKVLTYEQFKEFIQAMNYKGQMDSLANRERGKIRLAAKTLQKCPHLFYTIMKHK